MDAHALDVLEFPAILERLAGLTSTAAGEALARALEPSPDACEVARRQALTTEAVALLELGAHRLVGKHASDSADGATVAEIAATSR